jgi:II/X family phage/plasmid replication protein
MIGGAEMISDNEIKQRVLACAKTEGQGKAAYGCWMMIKSEGWDRAREFFAKPTWYRHLKILRAAGLRDADISAGQVVPLRRRILEAQMCTSWDQLRAA